MQNSTTKLFTTRNIAKIAILSAIAFVLMLIEFPLPFAPSFYKLDFSEVAVLLGGFAMGPLSAVAIEAVKILLELLFRGTITMGVGELANFLIGCALCVPASIIYKKNKTRKSAMKGMAVGTLCMIVAGVILNIFVLIPAYVAIANFPLEGIIGMGAQIFPAIHDVVSLALICVVPFNLLKGVAVSVITAVLYKHVSPLLHK
jgi:riboflavin transporter FmnP